MARLSFKRWLCISIIFVLFVLLTVSFGVYLKETFFYPRVSVLMSTYNRSDLLPRAIDSILAQTYKDFEFIIVNDGSTDNTQEILERYQKKDSRIKILTNSQNKGLVYSLNYGIKNAKGDYIARMDDDDYAISTRLQAQYNFMQHYQDVAVVGTSRYIHLEDISDEQIQEYIDDSRFLYKVAEYDADLMAITSYFEVPIFHPSAFIRTRFLKDHNISYSSKYESAEDTYLWFSIAQAGGKIIRLPTPLVLRGKSEKKQGYYSEQINNYHKFLEYSLKGIYPQKISGYPGHDTICTIIFSLESYIDKRPFITKESLAAAREAWSCSSDRIVFKHPKWVDQMSISADTIKRYENNDTATFKKEGNVYTLKWFDYPNEEKFECVSDHLCVFK